MPPQPTTVAELGRCIDVDLSAVGGLMQQVGDDGTNAPAHLFSGTGVPASTVGVNGDFYFRVDGGAGGSSTHIYFKTSGAWSTISF